MNCVCSRNKKIQNTATAHITHATKYLISVDMERVVRHNTRRCVCRPVRSVVVSFIVFCDGDWHNNNNNKQRFCFCQRKMNIFDFDIGDADSASALARREMESSGLKVAKKLRITLNGPLL